MPLLLMMDQIMLLKVELMLEVLEEVFHHITHQNQISGKVLLQEVSED